MTTRLTCCQRDVRRILTVLAGVLACGGGGAALAQGLCVACKGPPAIYRCTVKDSKIVEGVRGAHKAIEFVCITELARAGGHQSCRVDTTYSGPCIGIPRTIDVTKAGDAGVIVTGKPPPDSRKDAASTVPKKKELDATKPDATVKKKTPNTLQDLAQDTVKQSKKQIDSANKSLNDAGTAVGNAVKKSWMCLSSLFAEC